MIPSIMVLTDFNAFSESISGSTRLSQYELIASCNSGFSVTWVIIVPISDRSEPLRTILSMRFLMKSCPPTPS